MTEMTTKTPKTYYRNSAEICRQRIRERLQPRLQKLGSIQTGIAWQLCHNLCTYTVFTGHFRVIMMEMVQAGYADYIRAGVWVIHKNKFSA